MLGGEALVPGVEARHGGVGDVGQGLSGEVGLVARNQHVVESQQACERLVAQLVQGVIGKEQPLFILVYVQP